MTEEEKKKKEQANMTSPKTFDIRQDEALESPRPVVDAVSAAPIDAGVPTVQVPQMHDSRLDAIYVPGDVFVGDNTWIDQRDHSIHRLDESAIKAAPVANRQQTLGEAMSMARNNMNAALDESIAAEDKANAEKLEAAAARATIHPAGVYSSIFGPEETEPEKTELEKLDEARRQTYQEMIENRKKALQQQQTNDYRLASFNALGNALRTMVQPVGWAAGGSTAGVQPYDERQYLESFNRAVKANDDLRNLGMLEDQFKYKLADEEYQTQLALDAARAKEQRELAAYAAKSAIDTAAKKELLDSRYNREEDLARLKGQFNVKGKNGLTVEDRILINQSREYEKYRRSQMILKEPYISFEQWLRSEGYSVESKGGESDKTSGGNGDKTRKHAEV